MTDLLTATRRLRTGDGDRPAAPQQRPLAVGAAFAGAVASLSVLFGCLALALAGWFASDAAHGRTPDALRVGADAWLLGLGAHLDLTGAQLTFVPLGVTLVCVYVAHRLGRWAALTSAVEDRLTVGLGTVVLAGIYGVVALLTAVLASVPGAEPHLLRAFAGGAVVGLVGGGSGIAAGAGHDTGWWSRLPGGLRCVTRSALGGVLLLLAVSSVLLALSLLRDLTAAANVLARLHVDGPGGALATVLVAALTPNAVLLTGSYLLGPGFAVGAGTVVSPTSVLLGPVPAFPLLAALPPEGTPAWWTAGLLAVPALCSALGAGLALRRDPVEDYASAALRGLLGGLVAAVLLSVLVSVAGGAVGPGRMAVVGASTLATLAAAVASMVVGGVVGGLVTVALSRRAAA